MTEPIKNVTLGGLTYNANDVISATQKNDTYTKECECILKFKGGETLRYNPQPKSYVYYDADGMQIPEHKLKTLPKEVLDAEPGSGLWGGIRKVEVKPTVKMRNCDTFLIPDDNYFDISNVMGATFTPSKGNISHVTLNDCKDTVVNLADNESRFFGDTATIKGGRNNEVILDKMDSATINGKTVKGKGTAAQKDYEE